MISFDANILLPAIARGHANHEAASGFLRSLDGRNDVAVSEFVLVELYMLLRNPAVLAPPFSAPRAAEVCGTFRAHRTWRVLGFPPDSDTLHRELWERAAERQFARRRIADLRFGLALVQQGVESFATANVRDFQELGFRRVWNPLDL